MRRFDAVPRYGELLSSNDADAGPSFDRKSELATIHKLINEH